MMDATKTPPNWNQLAKQLADAPDVFLRKAAAAHKDRLEQRKVERRSKLDDSIKAAYHAANGCLEFDYCAKNYPFEKITLVDGRLATNRAPSATMRVPLKGRWMYVCAPDLLGNTHYWRHRRVLPEYMFKGFSGSDRKFSQGIVLNPDSRHRGKPDWVTPTYSVDDCKHALIKHHPDKGGDPEQAQIWTARLNAARKAKVSL
jgi:hypothetical protein